MVRVNEGVHNLHSTKDSIGIVNSLNKAAHGTTSQKTRPNEPQRLPIASCLISELIAHPRKADGSRSDYLRRNELILQNVSRSTEDPLPNARG